MEIRRRRLRRARQEAEVVVGKTPVLPRLDTRRERAKRRTGAAGKIGDRCRRMIGKRFGHRFDHGRVAGTAIKRLAKFEPGGAETAHVDASMALATSLAESRQVGSSCAAVRAPEA